MQRLEEYEDRRSWIFLNLNSPLISKLDLMWIFSSDLQLVGVLIAEYHLSNDRIRNSDQHKSCIPISLLFGSSWIIRFEFGSESYDSNSKMYPVRIWVKLASSHPLIFSLSIYLSVFDIMLDWFLANQHGFIESWILLVSIWLCF